MTVSQVNVVGGPSADTELAEALHELLPGIHRLTRGRPPVGDRAGLCVGGHDESGPTDSGRRGEHEQRGQFRLLIVLLKRGRLTMQDLAAAMEVTPPTVTGIVRRLMEQGYVTRSHDEDDWRTVWVELSDEGRAAIERRRQERIAALKSLVKQLADDDRAKLHAAVPVLLRLLELQP